MPIELKRLNQIYEKDATEIEKRKNEIISMSGDELVCKYSNLVKKVVYDTVKTTGADASVDFDDFYQIGSMAMVNAAKKYDGSTAFTTFAYTCIKRAILSNLRVRFKHMDFGNRTLMSEEEMVWTVDGSGAAYESFSDDMDTRFKRNDIHQAMIKIYNNAKPATQRNIEAFILRQYDEKSIEEIASIMNAPVDSVYQFVGQGKMYLAKQPSLRELACA